MFFRLGMEFRIHAVSCRYANARIRTDSREFVRIRGVINFKFSSRSCGPRREPLEGLAREAPHDSVVT